MKWPWHDLTPFDKRSAPVLPPPTPKTPEQLWKEHEEYQNRVADAMRRRCRCSHSAFNHPKERRRLGAAPKNGHMVSFHENVCDDMLQIGDTGQYRSCDCPAYLELGTVTYDRPPDPHVRGAFADNYPRGHRVEFVNKVTIADLLDKKDITHVTCGICGTGVKWVRRTGGMRNGEKGYWQHVREKTK